MPSPVLALPCGSRSMTSTLWPAAARAVARLTAVVVLPTPPFWLATAMIRARRDTTSGRVSLAPVTPLTPLDPGQAQDDPARVGAAVVARDIELPSFFRGGQFLPGLLALWEEAYRPGSDKALCPRQKPVERRAAARRHDVDEVRRQRIDSRVADVDRHGGDPRRLAQERAFARVRFDQLDPGYPHDGQRQP